MKINSIVSIIIPCYNREKFICESIDSALSQTYTNIEVVVVNDGSTDNSHQVISSRYQNKIKYIQQKNSGASVARNSAIKASIGEWILTLDSDDCISPTYVEDAVQLIEHEKTLVTARAFFFDAHMNKLDTAWPTGDLQNKKITLESIMQENQVVTTSLFNKKMWLKSGGYNKNLIRGEDWEFWVNLVSLGAEVKYLTKNEPYLKYRIHSDNISSKTQHLRDKTARFIKQKYKMQGKMQ
jgi:glycosyltransferase involved in cell wall biosynthesis